MNSRQGEAARFLDLACLTYGNDSTDRVERARRMLADRPSLAAIDAHTAAATANVEALRRILGEDARRASASGGPRRWPPLLYLCYSRVTEQLAGADTIGTARLLIEHGADPNAHFMWGRTYRFTALTGAMGEGEGGVASQPPHPHARELAELLLTPARIPTTPRGSTTPCSGPTTTGCTCSWTAGSPPATGSTGRPANGSERSTSCSVTRRPGASPTGSSCCSGTAPIRAAAATTTGGPTTRTRC